MHNPRLYRALEATAVLLFLVQAVRVLFSALFGLMYDTIFAEMVAFSTLGLVMLCIVAAFLSPLAARRAGRRALLATAGIAALMRVPLTFNQPTVRLWSGIVIVAAAGVYATALLRERPRLFPTALVLAFVADQFLRAAGNTYDISLRSWWLPAQAALALGVCAVAWLAFSRSPAEEPPDEGIGIPGGLAIGALLFLEASLLGFPNALARWSGVNYAIVAPLLIAVTLLPLISGSRQAQERLFSRMGRVSRFVWPLLVLLILATGKQRSGFLSGLLLIQFLILLAFFCIIGPCRKERVGLALALGMLLFLLLNFALAFAFTYPYTIPAFRDKGRYVFMLAAAIVYIPALLFKPAAPEIPSPNRRPLWVWVAGALVVALVVAFAWPPAFHPNETGPIRVATYNMHYGYDTAWHLSLEEQARAIEESGADIVMLQEVDTCRITSYGADDALWLSRRLGMREVYGPALERLSGIALLSRFPIAGSDTALLDSQLEQTAIVHARVLVGDKPLDAYGVWLGLEAEERTRQLDDALVYVGDAAPAVFGGDLNSTPDSPVYARLQAAGFDDPFVAGGFDPAPTDPAVEPRERIDFVWARGLEVRDARVLDSLASDHRLVVVELALP